MEKVTESERLVLKKMSVIGSYIRVGNYMRSMCEVIRSGKNGIEMQFRQSTLLSLQAKGLIDKQNRITQKGGEAAIKGHYTK